MLRTGSRPLFFRLPDKEQNLLRGLPKCRRKICRLPRFWHLFSSGRFVTHCLEDTFEQGLVGLVGRAQKRGSKESPKTLANAMRRHYKKQHEENKADRKQASYELLFGFFKFDLFSSSFLPSSRFGHLVLRHNILRIIRLLQWTVSLPNAAHTSTCETKVSKCHANIVFPAPGRGAKTFKEVWQHLSLLALITGGIGTRSKLGRPSSPLNALHRV